MLDLDFVGFEEYLQLKENREITIKRHLRTLRSLSTQVDAFTRDSLQAFLNAKKISGISGSTLNIVITTIRLYARFADLTEVLTIPLFSRKQKVVRRTLSDEQIEAFLAVPVRKWQLESSWKQWRCFWAFLAFCALRPSEAKQLLKSGIDLANKQIILRPEITKTDQFSTIPLFPNIFALVEEYVKECPDGLLFKSPRGAKHLSQRGWDEDFQYRLKYIGVEKVPGLVPYSLRHSCATRWIANDMNLYKVRRLMRHVKLEQTLTYEHMTSQHLVNTVVKFDPLVRKFAPPLEVLQAFKEFIRSFQIENDSRFNYRLEESEGAVLFEVSVKG